jgi:predicted phage-related endonuclease
MANRKEYKIGKLLFIDKTNMSHNQWLSIRDEGIGGSDVSSILDLNPYASITELFYQKIGQRPPVDLSENENVYWGSSHESGIIKAANYYNLYDSDRKNYLRNAHLGKRQRNIVDCNYMIKHEDYPWLVINIDGLVIDRAFTQSDFDNAIQNLGRFIHPLEVAEAKFMTGFTRDKWDQGLPIGYPAQATTYMIPFFHLNESISSNIWTLVDGNEFNAYPIPYSVNFANTIIERTHDFFELVKEGRSLVKENMDEDRLDHLLSDLAPRPDQMTPAYDDFLNDKLKGREKNKMVGDAEMHARVKKMNTLKAIKQQIERLCDIEGMIIKEFMDKENVRHISFNADERIVFSRRFYSDSVDVSEEYEDCYNELKVSLIKHKLINK